MAQKVDASSRAIGPSRSERVTFQTTSDVRRRLDALAVERGWTLSKATHLAVLAGLPLISDEMLETVGRVAERVQAETFETISEAARLAVEVFERDRQLFLRQVLDILESDKQFEQIVERVVGQVLEQEVVEGPVRY